MNGLRKEGAMMNKINIDNASNLVSTQIDMGDAGGGLQGGGEAVGGLFDFMKSFSESFDSLGGCSSDCIGSSLLNHSSEVAIGKSEGLWALSISEQLYELNTQVLILTGLIALFIIIYLAKPFVIHKLKQRNKANNKRDNHE